MENIIEIVNVEKVSCGGEDDHPHIYLHMSGNYQVQCPYCSKIFKYKESEKK